MSGEAGNIHLSTREASAAIVRLYCADSTADEQSLRVRIYTARDRAQHRSERADSPEGARIYGVAAAIASEWVFRPATADELNEVITSLSSMFLAAGRFDRIEKAAHGRG